MARLFDGIDDRLEKNAAAVTSTPLTMAIWFNTSDAANANRLIWLGDRGVTNHYFVLSANGFSAGDPVTAQVTASTTQVALSTTGYSVNTWHHAAAVFTSSTSRDAFIDGGSKGSNTNNLTPSGLNRTSIGRSADSSPTNYFPGRLAEAAIWNVALTDAEVAELATGKSPLDIQVGNLKGYWPIIGLSPELDYSSVGNDLVVTGATTADHAPIIVPTIPAAGVSQLMGGGLVR